MRLRAPTTFVEAVLLSVMGRVMTCRAERNEIALRVIFAVSILVVYLEQIGNSVVTALLALGKQLTPSAASAPRHGLVLEVDAETCEVRVLRSSNELRPHKVG